MMMTDILASQRTLISAAFLSSPFLLLEYVTCLLLGLSILLISILPLPILLLLLPLLLVSPNHKIKYNREREDKEREIKFPSFSTLQVFFSYEYSYGCGKWKWWKREWRGRFYYRLGRWSTFWSDSKRGMALVTYEHDHAFGDMAVWSRRISIKWFTSNLTRVYFWLEACATRI